MKTIKSIENHDFILGLYEGTDSKYYVGYCTPVIDSIVSMGYVDLNTALMVFDKRLDVLELQ